MISLRGSIGVLIIIVAVTDNATSQQITQSRRANCGAATTADSSSITFPISPDGDSFLPGEACLWTIHLESTRGFQFTLSNYSDDSNSLDCSEAGIGIYSLTNLVAGDKLLTYTFCSANPPPDTFALNENVAAVVLYVSGNASGDRVHFSQFNLTWEGSSFDPLETKHLTSFSNSPSGVIRYPTIGQYESSLAATWVVNSDYAEIPIRIDFVLERLGLQTCANPNPCFCDALILYSISESGLLEEKQRFCSDSTDVTLLGVESKFIVGFFTDFQAQSETGTGFQITYHPSESESSPTTPTTSTTVTVSSTSTEIQSTTTEIDPGLTECGTVFTSPSGKINYKETYNYDPNERCIWTLRVPGAIGYDFSFTSLDFNGEPADGLSILTLRRYDRDVIDSARLITSPGTQQMNGSVALVMLFSDASVENKGVAFTYEAIMGTNYISEDSKDVFITGYPRDEFSYPDSKPYYSNQELSTFIIVPEFKQRPGTTFRTDTYLRPGTTLRTDTNHRGLDPHCQCCDQLAIYELDNTQGAFWRYVYIQCNDSPSLVIEHSDVLLVVFFSDDEGYGTGFQITVREL